MLYISIHILFGQDRRGGWGPVWTRVGLPQVEDGPFLLNIRCPNILGSFASKSTQNWLTTKHEPEQTSTLVAPTFRVAQNLKALYSASLFKA